MELGDLIRRDLVVIGLGDGGETAWACPELGDRVLLMRPGVGDLSHFVQRGEVLAGTELTRAVLLDPQYPPAHLFYAWYLTTRGRVAAAVQEVQRARDLDPLSVVINTRLGTMLYYAGRYGDALVQLRGTLELDSTNALTHAEVARVLLQLGRCPEALEAIRSIPASFPNVEGAVSGYAYAVCGRRGEALRLVRDLRERANHGFVFASRVALLEEGLGEDDEALAWLNRAIEQRDPTSSLLAVEPMYRRLRSDPRFQQLLAKAGLLPQR